MHPSYRKFYADTTEVKKKIFADLKDNAYFDEVIHDEEDEVDEIVPKTELESQTQSQGCPDNSSRRA